MAMKAWVTAIWLCVLAASASADARTYGACMLHCVPEEGFSNCNRFDCASADSYTYDVCMSYCVPEEGFDSCNRFGC